MTKQECIEKLNIIAEKSEKGYYHYSVKINEWEGYGKSRTYFKIYETKEGTKHFKSADFGYFDNKNNEYIAGKNGDVTENYTFGGSEF